MLKALQKVTGKTYLREEKNENRVMSYGGEKENMFR